jgi:Pectate lyase superfamily protein
MTEGSERSLRARDASRSPRRRIAWYAAWAALGIALITLTVHRDVGGSTKRVDQGGSVYNVREIGARGDGAADDTAAFQRALDRAGAEGGGVVLAPRGRYLFRGHLVVPPHVTLEGIWRAPTSHPGVRDAGMPRPEFGTVFLATEGEGSEKGPPFIALTHNSVLKGVVLYYPHQDPARAPRPYPWSVQMRGSNPAVLDVELLNPYQAIDASQNQRHLIRNVTGQPLRRGIWVDEIYDIGRIENVHFNPWWSMQPALLNWQMEHGEAFVIGRSDWQYVLNTFCFGYNIGYHFVETARGACNGNFLGIGADDCYTACQVDQSAPFGLLITNGEFVSFHGPDPTMVRVGPRHSGTVRFVNCAFWGPNHQIGRIEGEGTVGFSDCTLMQWDSDRKGRAAIQAEGGTLLVRGCEFKNDAPQVRLGPGVRRAVIAENVFAGRERILNETREASVQIGLNASTPEKAAPQRGQ